MAQMTYNGESRKVYWTILHLLSYSVAADCPSSFQRHFEDVFLVCVKVTHTCLAFVSSYTYEVLSCPHPLVQMKCQLVNYSMLSSPEIQSNIVSRNWIP
jgi:hypothetical protein